MLTSTISKVAILAKLAVLVSASSFVVDSPLTKWDYSMLDMPSVSIEINAGKTYCSLNKLQGCPPDIAPPG